MQWSSSLKTRNQGNAQQIFDSVRRKWVSLTPEEVVRQLLISYFAEEHQFPLARMSVERGFLVLGMQRRYDLVLFDNNAAPLLLAECKAPSVPVDQRALDQVARYNIELHVPYLFVTNGREAYCCQVDFEQKNWKFIETIPPLN